jgi:hypothetical protein
MQTRTIERRRTRVDRREAAQLLHCSRDNVRRLDRVGQLKTGTRDRNGTFTYDRREIEDLARRRGLGVKPSGELVALVFELFKTGKPFEDVCIATKQEPDVIQSLWERYRGGYDYGKKLRAETDEAREQHEHDVQMRAMDREIERRRRGATSNDDELVGGDRVESARASARGEPLTDVEGRPVRG